MSVNNKGLYGDGQMMEGFSGRWISLADPQPEQICLEDVARGLASQVRFNGQTKSWCSLAQHSLEVAELFELPWEKAFALLHDASEAYLGDINRPLKCMLDRRLSAEDLAASIEAAELGLPSWSQKKLHAAILERSPPTYRDIANRLQRVIEEALVPPQWHELRDSAPDFAQRLRAADNAACRIEAYVQKVSRGLNWDWGDTPWGAEPSEFLSPSDAEAHFLKLARELLGMA